MTYQNPFACMNDCAQGTCMNRTTGCQWQCEARKGNGQTVHGLPVVETTFVGVGVTNIARAEIVALPFAILPDELEALKRFHECALDGEGYDVPQEMMSRLTEIGLLRRKSGRYYEETIFGLSVLNGDFATAQPADKQEGKAEQQAESAANLCERLRAMKLGPCNDAADFIERMAMQPQLSDEEIIRAVADAKVMCVHPSAATTLDIARVIEEMILSRQSGDKGEVA